jgi:hypothetical protein
MAGTPRTWIGIRSIPTYGPSAGPPATPVIHACAALTMHVKPIAVLLMEPKPIASIAQRPC